MKVFQSTPPQGGDPYCRCLFRSAYHFNPRPRKGATQYRYSHSLVFLISIHAPARGRLQNCTYSSAKHIPKYSNFTAAPEKLLIFNQQKRKITPFFQKNQVRIPLKKYVSLYSALKEQRLVHSETRLCAVMLNLSFFAVAKVIKTQ